jgi:hypothetical protein
VKCRLIAALAVAVVAMSIVTIPAAQAAASCTIGGSNGEPGILIYGTCYPIKHQIGSGPTVPMKTVFCGRPSSGANGLWNPACGTPRVCVQLDKTTGKPIPVDAFATFIQIHGTWTRHQVWCPADGLPALNLAAVRARVLRLLPHVAIGSAWTTTALVNAQTILWADTPPQRPLGSVDLFGHQIQLRISLTHANWDFGDGHTDTATTPGKAYNESTDPCRTVQCPGYYGHTYRTTGTMTITLTLTWHAQYSLDTQHWIDITDPITAPTSHHTLTVEQTRGILIPDDH